MATALDTLLIPKIKSLVDDYGKDVTFTIHGISSYDPNDGSVVDSGSIDYVVKATPPMNYSSDMIDGDAILLNDCSISIPAQNLLFTPKTGLVVTFDNEAWTVVGIRTEYTGESIGLYTMQLRR
tara:strand:- start:229 stop:600 length:372 start_codon:yes stop_codon:yes gene_type:complete